MSKDRLVVHEDRHGYRIVWFLADEQDHGATLGEGWSRCDDDDPYGDHGIATRAAKKTLGVERDERGFYWESRSVAQTALKVIKAALKNKPLEDWEQKALAAGWKPPAGRM